MKCPHCKKDAEFKVLESRRIDDAVWRLRSCRTCFKPFVSKETASVDLRMPYSTLMRQRKADKPPPPKREREGPPRGDARHLQGIWS